MSKLDGMASRNEEQANEAWDDEMADLVGEVERATHQLDIAIEHRNTGRIIEALQEIDAATEEIFKRRHGPEAPE